ncbi:MAG: dihydrofolate reductase [Armatimonadetes bacterium]|nr:dihydrofolate reductase [Armatimonadota bacterium]
MRVSLVVAVAENGVIGRGGDLPWRLRADLRRFRDLTTGHVVVMGRRTHESILRRVGRPLPKRRSIVMTRTPGYRAEGCLVVSSWEEAMAAARGEDEVFVIGGAEVFRLALPHASRIYLTRVHADVPGDTFFAEIDPARWRVLQSERRAGDADNEFDCTFQILAREVVGDSP